MKSVYHLWKFERHSNTSKVFVCMRCGSLVESSRFPSPKRLVFTKNDWMNVDYTTGRNYYSSMWSPVSCIGMMHSILKRIHES